MFDYEVNERIRDLRKKKGWSKKHIAKMLNMKYTTYVRLEDSGNINTYMLKKFAEIFSIDVKFLLYGEIACNKFNKPEKIDTSLKNTQKLIIGYELSDMTLTVLEKNIIKIMRFFNKEDREKVLDLINQICNKN